jgi:hypothetical protein
MVGAVFRPKDLAKDHKSLIENSLRDTNPDIKDGVIDFLDSWKEKATEQKLKEVRGQEMTESLLDRITKESDDKEQKKKNL